VTYYDKKKDSLIIGWDYGHIGDYIDFPDKMLYDRLFPNNKKYSLAEIVDDIKEILGYVGGLGTNENKQVTAV